MKSFAVRQSEREKDLRRQVRPLGHAFWCVVCFLVEGILVTAIIPLLPHPGTWFSTIDSIVNVFTLFLLISSSTENFFLRPCSLQHDEQVQSLEAEKVTLHCNSYWQRNASMLTFCEKEILVPCCLYGDKPPTEKFCCPKHLCWRPFVLLNKKNCEGSDVASFCNALPSVFLREGVFNLKQMYMGTGLG